MKYQAPTIEASLQSLVQILAVGKCDNLVCGLFAVCGLSW